MRRRLGNPLLAVAYVRVSTDDQRLGPEAQRAAIESWAAHNGVRLVAVHIDQGVSGASPIDARPGLSAALAATREHKAGVLLVAKRDRIARDVNVTWTVEQAAAKMGARLVSADGTSNATGVEGMMLRGMTDLFAAVEREMIRARTKAALAAKSAKGERVGTVAFGFMVASDGVHVVPCKLEGDIIAHVRELHLAGLSHRRIAVQLASEGVCSPRSGRPLNATQVGRLLLRRSDNVGHAAA